MNTTVWKFPVTRENITMPKGARLMTVQMQNGTPMLWAEVDPKAPTVEHCLFIVGTGWNDGFPEGCIYLATYQDGALVFHVYDMGEAEEIEKP